MEKTEFKLIPDQNGIVKIEQRTGELPSPIEITSFEKRTTIEGPTIFLLHRGSEYDEPYVTYDYQNGEIIVETNPGHPHSTTICGRLVKSDPLKRFGINTDTKFSRKDLMKVFKFNRRFFTSLEECGNIVAKLSNLEVKANQEIKKADDERGNIAFKFEQLVSSELPESFNLNIPIYVGTRPVEIPVDLRFNVAGSAIEFWLESPELETILEDFSEELIDEQIDQIRENGFLCLELS